MLQSRTHDNAVNFKDIIFYLSSVGAFFPTVELACYIAFFHHTIHHDNTVAIIVIQPEVLKLRNKRNAISMVGLLASWLMELWYIIIVGLLTAMIKDPVYVRDVATLIKMFEFVLLPMVQIFTSEPIKRFLMS